MNNFWIYLLKSGLALWLFYGIYWLFLRKETFFSLNRYMLLGSVIFSFLLPFIHFENLFAISGERPVALFFIGSGEDIPGISSYPAVENELAGFKIIWPVVMFIVYLSGIVFLGSRMVYQGIRLYRIRQGYEHMNKDGMKLLFIKDDITPFSFFNRIFINRSAKTDEELEKIITHEKAHVKNMHCIDLILVGIAGILQWFNPVIWFYERSIREIHEYEADREVLKYHKDRGKYQALLVNQITGIEIFRFANGFSKSITKKRMIMMTKNKSRKFSYLKALFVLPLVLLLVFAFSKPQIISESSALNFQNQVSGIIVDDQSDEPLSGAAVIIENTTNGTKADENGKYLIEISGNDQVLVFSYVGYETQRIKADTKEINVRMKRRLYEIPEGKSTKIIRDELPEQTGEDIYFLVEEMPAFQGRTPEAFREYLQENLAYPEEAKEKNIDGKVYVQMIVNSKGEVADVKVLRGVHPLLDKEAVRVVESSPLWEPGKQNGKAVAVAFTFPVEFKLPE
jgi:TonB family protein